jgi:predicted secreted hydrolase
MDHEFGSADLAWISPGGIDSYQLADKRELMIYRLRHTGGSSDAASSGTLVWQTAAQRLSATDIN